MKKLNVKKYNNHEKLNVRKIKIYIFFFNLGFFAKYPLSSQGQLAK